MTKTGIAGGKTNRHKSTSKAHTRSQVVASTPKSRGKPSSGAAPKRRARAS